MIYAPLRFGGVFLGHNPKSLYISSKKNERKIVFSGDSSIFEALEKDNRTVWGVGEFVGDDCFEQYNHLCEIFNRNEAMCLSIGEMTSFRAFFTKLKIAALSEKKVLEFEFEFVEESSENKKENSQREYIATNDENLWNIAFENNTSVEKLLILNKWIKRPDEIFKGDVVRLC